MVNCDVCTRKSATTVSINQCLDCEAGKQNFCQAHRISHDAMFPEHKTVSGPAPPPQPAPPPPVVHISGSAQAALGMSKRLLSNFDSVAVNEWPMMHGVSDLPIVTLEKAVEQLVRDKLVPSLTKQVEDVLKYFKSHTPKHGLSVDQAAAIRLYTIEAADASNSLYWRLNASLRSADRTQARPYFSYIRLLNSAMDILRQTPGVQNGKTVGASLWRGVKLDLLANFPMDKEVVWWPFTSMTKDLAAVEAFLEVGAGASATSPPASPPLYTLFNVNGADEAVSIADFSTYKGEAELLLPPGTCLKVHGVSPATRIVQLTVLPGRNQVN